MKKGGPDKKSLISASGKNTIKACEIAIEPEERMTGIKLITEEAKIIPWLQSFVYSA